VTPAAVLFDCDGVLADSEGLVNAIVAADLAARGWRMTPKECQEQFLGMAATDMVPVIEARVGRLPADWLGALSHRIARSMITELQPVEGALATVRAIAAAGVPVAVASNSAREELHAKLRRLGLASVFEGRAFSFQDVARPKPAPDMYLAAAISCGAEPRDCVVVEDSVLGAKAGLAAGCRVMGLTRETDASIFAGIGAAPFLRMADLPGLLGLR
jgi:HAD superfamily hydrolase (TIGR01509 family)